MLRQSLDWYPSSKQGKKLSKKLAYIITLGILDSHVLLYIRILPLYFQLLSCPNFPPFYFGMLITFHLKPKRFIAYSVSGMLNTVKQILLEQQVTEGLPRRLEKLRCSRLPLHWWRNWSDRRNSCRCYPVHRLMLRTRSVRWVTESCKCSNRK